MPGCSLVEYVRGFVGETEEDSMNPDPAIGRGRDPAWEEEVTRDVVNPDGGVSELVTKVALNEDGGERIGTVGDSAKDNVRVVKKPF